MPPVTDNDPSLYNIPGAASTIGTIAVAPAPSSQVISVNLAPGASVSVDFSIENAPWLDVILYADQILDVLVYLRTDELGTFRLLDGVKQGSGVANQMKQVIRGLRLGGLQAKVEFTNNSAVATTVLEAMATFRGV